MTRTEGTGGTDGTRRGATDRGALYVVATPIGNLADMTARAVEVLRSADLILAEDTRHSAKLLGHYQIETPCQPYHEHNESRLVTPIVERIAAGERVALISDAGTPLISDPGFRLVAALRARGLRVVPVPGPNAAIGALSAAGLATDRFCFEGFLPARAAARRRRLQALASEPRTLIFYESPHRLTQSLRDMGAAFGLDRPAVLAREMTKVHETFVSGTLADVLARVEAHAEARRGECVLVVAGAPAAEPLRGVAAESGALLLALLEELPLKQAVGVAARVTGEKRNELYREAIRLSGARGDAEDQGPP